MAAAKCPHCSKPITRINAHNVDVYVDGVASYKGATFACGLCNMALTAEIDPIALKPDTIKNIKGR